MPFEYGPIVRIKRYNKQTRRATETAIPSIPPIWGWPWKLNFSIQLCVEKPLLQHTLALTKHSYASYSWKFCSFYVGCEPPKTTLVQWFLSLFGVVEQKILLEALTETGFRSWTLGLFILTIIRKDLLISNHPSIVRQYRTLNHGNKSTEMAKLLT